jgi:hypothetical protein
VKHRATPRFWQSYNALPESVQHLADKAFQQLKQDARRPSLQFKKVGMYWSVRIGLYYRALAVQDASELVWFWTGTHAEYDKLIGRS